MNETLARRDIVAYGALLWQRRLTTGTSGNVSVLLDDGDIIVTPAAVSLRALYESQLVRVDRTGVPRDPMERPTSELPLHLAAYEAAPNIRAVIHTHPTYCVVWGKRFRSVFPQDTVGATETLGQVAWTPFRPAGSPELAKVCAAEFARGIPTVLMERHGLSTVGATLEDAFVLADLAEEAARLALLSQVTVLP
jgi:L-fuculose-phosphate aldolase